MAADKALELSKDIVTLVKAGNAKAIADFCAAVISMQESHTMLQQAFDKVSEINQRLIDQHGIDASEIARLKAFVGGTEQDMRVVN